MFFHFHEPLGFLNAANDSHDPYGTRGKQYHSVSEHVSGILYGLTYWGDYGGDSLTRYHYDSLLENAPHLVTSVEGAYGQGLVLTHVFYPVDERGTHAINRDEIDSSEISYLKEFLSWAIDAPSYYGMTRKDYPVFDENDYSDWEFHKIEEILKEDVEGWMGSDIRSTVDSLTNWEFEGDIEDAEIFAAIDYLLRNREEYPYFESATTIILPGIRSEQIAQRILDVRNGDAQSHQDETLF